MSELLLQLTSEALLGNLDALREQAKGARQTSDQALPFAIAGLLVISGNRHEIGGYRSISNYEVRRARSLFLTAQTVAAHRLLQAHPELADEVLSSEIIRPSLDIGPFSRLSRSDQALKALQILLADSQLFVEYQRRGLLGWDDGDTQGAMGIVYTWRKAVATGRGVLQPVSHIHQEGRLILSTAITLYPENALLTELGHRANGAWASQTPGERATSMAALQSMVQETSQEPRQKTIYLFGLSSLMDVGFRLRELEEAQAALDELQQTLVPERPEHPHILVQRAWGATLEGNYVRARELASVVAASNEQILYNDITEILAIVGNVQTARDMRHELSAEFYPYGRSPVLSLQFDM